MFMNPGREVVDVVLGRETPNVIFSGSGMLLNQLRHREIGAANLKRIQR